VKTAKRRYVLRRREGKPDVIEAMRSGRLVAWGSHDNGVSFAAAEHHCPSQHRDGIRFLILHGMTGTWVPSADT